MRRSPHRDGVAFEPPPDWSGAGSFGGGMFTGAASAAFSDFFWTLFGDEPKDGGFARHSMFSSRGNDVHGRVEISLEWRFSASAVFRIRRAINLCDDLGMNLPGASLAVELLEELDQLQAEVARLSRIAHQ